VASEDAPGAFGVPFRKTAVFWTLTATDLHDHVWRAEWVDAAPSTTYAQPGAIVRGSMDRITGTQETRAGSGSGFGGSRTACEQSLSIHALASPEIHDWVHCFTREPSKRDTTAVCSSSRSTFSTRCRIRRRRTSGISLPFRLQENSARADATANRHQQRIAANDGSMVVPSCSARSINDLVARIALRISGLNSDGSIHQSRLRRPSTMVAIMNRMSSLTE
jgi:hypothetical protein